MQPGNPIGREFLMLTKFWESQNALQRIEYDKTFGGCKSFLYCNCFQQLGD